MGESVKWLWVDRIHPCCANLLFDTQPDTLYGNEKYYWEITEPDGCYRMGYDNGSFYLNYLLYPLDYIYRVGYGTGRNQHPFIHALEEVYIDKLKLHAKKERL